VYATNSNAATPTLRGYSISATGALVPVENETLNGNPDGVAVTPDGKRLYAAGGSNLFGFTIGADGTLAAVPGPNPTVNLNGLAVTPDGRFLYGTSSVTDAVARFSIGADGTLTSLGAVTPTGDVDPTDIAVSPDGRHLYATNHDFTVGSGSVSAFAIAADGTLTPVTGSPFGVGPTVPNQAAGGLAITPDGSRLFAIREAAGNNVYAFDRQADGSLVAVPGSPFPSGASLVSVQFANNVLAAAPNQGPSGAFTTTPTGGLGVAFNGATSTDPDGQVARYDWDFGDGQTLASGGAAPAHAYPAPGSYTATLTVTDNEGCSLTQVFAGQTAYCNGSAAARATQTVVVPPPTAAESIAPVVSGLTLAARFRVARAPTPVVARVRKGTMIRYTVSEAAAVRIVIQRAGPGRRAGGKCSKPTRALRNRPRCTRFVRAGTLRRSAKAGANRHRFSGRIGRRALRPGRHRVVLRATDAAGNVSKPARRAFRVVR
jgi:6-phosphogluconolactonase (cycloisomerase 2 family)